MHSMRHLQARSSILKIFSCTSWKLFTSVLSEAEIRFCISTQIPVSSTDHNTAFPGITQLETATSWTNHVAWICIRIRDEFSVLLWDVKTALALHRPYWTLGVNRLGGAANMKAIENILRTSLQIGLPLMRMNCCDGLLCWTWAFIFPLLLVTLILCNSAIWSVTSPVAQQFVNDCKV